MVGVRRKTVWKQEVEVKKFSINLKSNQVVYYPGQHVRGVVALDVAKADTRNDLIIKFLGKSQCSFEGRTGKHGRGADAHHAIFSKEHTILENEKHVEKLTEGFHEVKFDFVLPTSIPSSLEAPHGNIRYEVRAHIGDIRSVVAITVNEVIDSNKTEYQMKPSGESVQDVSCLCLMHGALEIFAELDRGCYCPGEAILMSVKIKNETKRNMKSLQAKLLQTIKYKTKNRTKAIDNVIATLKGPKVPKGDSHEWKDQAFGIPAVVPSISSDAVISVEYFMVIEVGVPLGSDLGVKFPFIIGTVPHLETYGREVKYGTPQDPKTAPASNLNTDAIVDPAHLGYPDMPEPSYSAPIGQGIVNVTYDDDPAYGNTSYYPVYTFVKPEDGKRVKKSEKSGGRGIMFSEVVESIDEEEIEPAAESQVESSGENWFSEVKIEEGVEDDDSSSVVHL